MRREVMAFVLIAVPVAIVLLMELGLLPPGHIDPVTGQTVAPESVQALIGILLAVVALVLPRAKPVQGLDRPVRIWRRGVAFWVDMITGSVIVGTILGLMGQVLTLIIPRTAQFSFYETDGQLVVEYLVAANLLVLAALASFFWLHAKLGRPTIGQYIMGYRIENDPDPDNPPRRLLGMFAGLLAGSSWHIWGWFVKYEDTQKGNYWWDRIGRTHAVFVGPY